MKPKSETGTAGGPGPRETFYSRVYAVVRLVPRGRVTNYGHIALLLGSPAAARAVGYALNALGPGNDVPWWRIVNAAGGIVLKNRGSSADLQRALLEREGVRFREDDTCDLRVYRWWPEESVAGAPDGAGPME